MKMLLVTLRNKYNHKEERQLLHEPDMIVPLLKSLENILRTTINEKYSKYSSVYDYLNKKLNSNEAWSDYEEKRTSILKRSGLENSANCFRNI